MKSLHAATGEDAVDRLLVTEGNKAKAAGPSVVMVIHNNSILYSAKALEVSPEGCLVYAGGQATNKYFFAASLTYAVGEGLLARPVVVLGHGLFGINLLRTEESSEAVHLFAPTLSTVMQDVETKHPLTSFLAHLPSVDGVL